MIRQAVLLILIGLALTTSAERDLWGYPSLVSISSGSPQYVLNFEKDFCIKNPRRTASGTNQ